MTVSEDGSTVTVTYESPERVDGFALSPDGTQVVTYTIDRSVDTTSGVENIQLAVWDAKTGNYRREIRLSGGLIQTIRFSPDGKSLAIGSGNQIWMWDAADWQVEERFTGHVGDIVDLAFTPDGTGILSAGSDGTIRLWPVEQ